MSGRHQVRYLDFKHLETQRLDNYLLQIYKNVPRSLIYRIIRTGQVRVNGGRKRAYYRLQKGDQIRVPPLSVEETSAVQIPQGFRDRIYASIVFETPSFLVLDKPSGVASHAGSGVPYGCIEALNYNNEASSPLYLGHRLDRDTSGILIIAKDRQNMQKLHAAFRSNEVIKEYTGLVHGIWPATITTISKPLERYLLPNGERRVKVSREGQASLTECAILASYSDATRMEFRPKTGRTHQLRVHASHIGHAIFGDLKYASSAERNATDRLMLHASRITLPTGESFAVEPSEDFERNYAQIIKEG